MIFSESKAALHTLSRVRYTCPKLVNRIRHVTLVLTKDKIRVKFVWISSHIGIPGTSGADLPARTASRHRSLYCNLGLAIRQLKSRIQVRQTHETKHSRSVQQAHSASINHYNKAAMSFHVFMTATYTYGKKNTDMWVDCVLTRVRLGYKCPWQQGWQVAEADRVWGVG